MPISKPNSEDFQAAARVNRDVADLLFARTRELRDGGMAPVRAIGAVLVGVSRALADYAVGSSSQRDGTAVVAELFRMTEGARARRALAAQEPR